MTEPYDPNQPPKEFFDSIRKMMAQMNAQPDPQAQRQEEQSDQSRAQKWKKIQDFNLKPKDIKKYLDRFVIKQDEAKRVLSTAICDHYNHIKLCQGGDKCQNYSKQNVILLGPTGVGKTYLVRMISNLIGVPFAKADATKFSETGYVGGDVEDLIRDLAHRAEGDLKLAECGIIYLDEVDKIASSSSVQGRDVSGAGVQRGLLKIMEDTDVLLRNPQDVQSQIQGMMEFQQKGKISRPALNTKHILFIVSGSFSDMIPLIEKRIHTKRIGFDQPVKDPKDRYRMLHEVQTEDFIAFGFEPEFIGRLPVKVTCDPLESEDLYKILTQSEGSILRQIEDSFSAYGIRILFEDTALWDMAKQAAVEKTGARALVTVTEQILRDLKYELPSSEIREFHVTQELVRSPKQALEELMKEENLIRQNKLLEIVEDFEKNFYQKYGILIEFTAPARQKLVEIISEHEPVSFVEKLFSNYPYGLGLIQKKKPREKYLLMEDNVKNPNEILEAWIKNSYEEEQ